MGRRLRVIAYLPLRGEGGRRRRWRGAGHKRSVCLVPNEDAITRLVGAILLEQNDEWAVQSARYMTLESAMIRLSRCLPWQHERPG